MVDYGKYFVFADYSQSANVSVVTPACPGLHQSQKRDINAKETQAAPWDASAFLAFLPET